MKKLTVLFLILISANSYADTIAHYMEIANNIPRMEMKADEQAQTWARSARNVILLSSESIWESLNIANQTQAKNGTPLFCVPNPSMITAESMADLIQYTYESLNGQDKEHLTVAQVALMGLQKKYPCAPSTNNQPSVTIQARGTSPVAKMMHMGTF
jgi:hypothetical protein